MFCETVFVFIRTALVLSHLWSYTFVVHILVCFSYLLYYRNLLNYWHWYMLLYKDELPKLLEKFSSRMKKTSQKNKDNASSLNYPIQTLSKDSLLPSNQEKTLIQNQLISQFLFLRPTHRRLVEFISDLVLKNFLKSYRKQQPKPTTTTTLGEIQQQQRNFLV